MTPKTKTTTTLSAAAKSRQALDQAEAEHVRLAARQDQATATVDDLTARLSGGDQDVTPTEWTTAHAEQEISTRLLAWAEQRVKNARTRLINDDTRLADLFSPLLAELFEGMVPVHTTGNPADVIPGEDNAPALWVVQDKATVNTGGVLSGTLGLVYVRPSPILGVLDADLVAAAAKRAGYGLRPSGMATSTSRASGGGYRDALRVVVESAAPAVPYLTQPPSVDYSRHVGYAVADAVFPVVKGPSKRGPGDDSVPGSIQLVSHDVQTKKAPESGVIATVRTVHHVLPGSKLLTETNRISQTIREYSVPDLVGHLVAEAGRITAAEVTGIDYPSDDPAAPKAPWVMRSSVTLTYQL